ncbi:MAG: glycosyltransferase [Pyrinomonadaceae bacterium]
MTLSAERPQPNPKSTGDSAPDVTVVIAALNEQENLELLLPLVATEMKQLGLVPEIIVVDGGSHDATQSVAKKLGAFVVEQTERGYGGALIAGFAAARAPFVITMDADLSHPPEFLKDFWEHRTDSDLIVASRYMPGGQAEMGIGRRVLSTILNRTYAVLLDVKLRDLSSGFRMYDRRALMSLDLRARDFDILEEILVKIYLRGGRVREVPFHYKVRNAGQSHAKLIRFGWAYSRTLLRMCRLRYGK